MLQYKIFRMFNQEHTEEILKEVFGEEILIFKHNLVAIPYDYGKKGYKYVLEKVKELEVKQLIITPMNFLKMLEFAIINNNYINNITFIESIPGEEKEFIDDYKQRLNKTVKIEDKQLIMDKLSKELEWLTFDESIDMKSIGLRCKGKNTQLKFDLELYNNGVLLIDDISIIDQAKELITYINE